MFWWCGGIPFCPTHHGNFDEVLGERDGFLLLFPSDRICVETAMKTEGGDEQPGCGRELGWAVRRGREPN